MRSKSLKMEIQIENLRAKMRGDKLNHYQEGLALDEFEKLIAHTEALTEQLRQYNVGQSEHLVCPDCKQPFTKEELEVKEHCFNCGWEFEN